MSKTHRGTGIRTMPNHGRGKCGLCGKEQIKVLFEKEVDGNKIQICKFCNAKLKNQAKKDAKAAKKAAPAAEEANA